MFLILEPRNLNIFNEEITVKFESYMIHKIISIVGKYRNIIYTNPKFLLGYFDAETDHPGCR